MSSYFPRGRAIAPAMKTARMSVLIPIVALVTAFSFQVGGFADETDSEPSRPEVTESAGVGRQGRWCTGTTYVDVDNDGDLDLFVSVFNAPNLVYVNQGDGTFQDQAKERGLDFSGASVMMAFADYDRNGGMGRFTEVARTALPHVPWASMSADTADLNNDGWVDLFVSNGMSRDFVNSNLAALMKGRGNRGWRNKPVLREANLAFRNVGNLEFRSEGKRWGLDHVGASFDAVVGDLDKDGDLDMVVTHFNEPVSVYRNMSPPGNRVLIRLKGTTSDMWGIGAKVKVMTRSGM